MNSGDAALQFHEVRSPREFVLAGERDFSAPFTQSWQYGAWQEKMGRRVRRFAAPDYALFQTVVYPLTGRKSYLYIPHGPLVRGKTTENFLTAFYRILHEISAEENAVFARFDFYPPRHDTSPQVNAIGKLFRKAPPYSYRSAVFQPKHEWIIDLRKDDAVLLGEMHQKTRYNIRLAERKGIRIAIVSRLGEHFETFYALLRETAERDGFSLHPRAHYETVIESGELEGNVHFVFGYYGEEALVVHLICIFGGTAYYLYGGSSGRHRNLMAPYLAHWEAMRDARRRGCRIYNFGGTTPGEDAWSDGWRGFAQFKKKFGGSLFTYSDMYDAVYHTALYRIYNFRKWINSVWR